MRIARIQITSWGHPITSANESIDYFLSSNFLKGDNDKKIFSEMNEKDFIEGGALNSFGVKYDYNGKDFTPGMKYCVLGTTINDLIESSILEIPDYIKIDVDGNELKVVNGVMVIIAPWHTTPPPYWFV